MLLKPAASNERKVLTAASAPKISDNAHVVTKNINVNQDDGGPMNKEAIKKTESKPLLPKALPTQTTSQASSKSAREYSSEEIAKLTSEGYIIVHPGLWEYIPVGSHVRYIKKDDGSDKPRGKRFKPGGFVKNHNTNEAGEKMFTLESRLSTGPRSPPGYIKYSILYDNIEVLWKKYDRMAFIEIHLVYNSLAQKKQQIEDLSARVSRLEKTIERLGKRNISI
jgi:hypothetical protein